MNAQPDAAVLDLSDPGALDLGEVPALDQVGGAALVGASLQTVEVQSRALRANEAPAFGTERVAPSLGARLLGSAAASGLRNLGAAILKPGQADRASRKAFSGEEDKAESPVALVERRWSSSAAGLRMPRLGGGKYGTTAPRVAAPTQSRGNRAPRWAAAAAGTIIALLTTSAAFATSSEALGYFIAPVSPTLFYASSTVLTVSLVWTVGVAVAHAAEEGIELLWEYFGYYNHNKLVQTLPQWLGFLAIVFPALVIQALAAFGAFGLFSPFAFGALIGARLGDWWFSHFWPSRKHPDDTNPGIATSWIYLVDGLALAAIFHGTFASSWAWLGLLAGAGFFAAVQPLIRLTGPLGDRFLAWRNSGRANVQ